jgi:hypothetical protein
LAAAAFWIAMAILAGCASERVDRVVEIAVQNGAVVGGPDSISAVQGDGVTLLVESDADATLHAHGLPEMVAVRAGEPAQVVLNTTYVGQFDVELHLVPADQTAMAAEGDSGVAVEPGVMTHGGPVPAPAGMSVAISLTPDSADGLNLEILTTGFEWAPEGAGGEHVPGEGHAHVYVDGIKHVRAYGPWLHLSGLAAGTRHIRVTLNGNTHGEYTRDGRPVAAQASADVAVAGAGGGHGDFALVVAKLNVTPP